MRLPRQSARCRERSTNFSVDDLAQISVPVVIVQSEKDEFIKQEHAEYLARSIPKRNSSCLLGSAILRRCRGRSNSIPKCWHFWVKSCYDNNRACYEVSRKK